MNGTVEQLNASIIFVPKNGMKNDIIFIRACIWLCIFSVTVRKIFFFFRFVWCGKKTVGFGDTLRHLNSDATVFYSENPDLFMFVK